MDAVQLFEEVFPIKSELVWLERVESHEREDGSLALTLRIVVCERHEGEITIRDIKEQEVYVLSKQQRDDPRLAECIAGWAEAVRVVLEDEEHMREHGDALMPYELCVVGHLLRRKRPRVASDFTHVALTVRSLLGKYTKQ